MTNYAKMFVFSFIRPRAFRDVILGWQGYGLLYALLVFAVGFVPGTLWMHKQIGDVLGSSHTDNLPASTEMVIEMMPPLTIKNGTISSTPPEMQILSPPNTNEPIIIIDTENQRSTNETAPLIITNKHLILDMGEKSFPVDVSTILEVFGAQDEKELTLTANSYRQWLLELKSERNSFPFIFYIGSVTGKMITFGFWALLLSIAASALAGSRDLKLPFAATMRLSVVAGTPIMLLHIIETSLGISLFAYPTIVHFAIHFFCIWRAIDEITPFLLRK